MDTKVKRPTRSEILSLLLSIDPKDRKDGLQMVCGFLERGGHLRLEHDLVLSAALARQRESDDIVTRRWFYKYAGLSGNEAYLPFLKKSLYTETDAQGQAWLLGAIASISGLDEARTYANELDLPDDVVRRVPIFASYFHREILSEDSVIGLMGDDHPLSLRWISFIHGRWREAVLGKRISDLNTHSDPEVAEFSIWSVLRSGAGFRASSIDPDDLPRQPAPVRRWSYYLLASDTLARTAYSDIVVQHSQAEPDERAREGLARGLVAGGLRGQWVDFANAWADVEMSDRVARVLRRGLPDNRQRGRRAAGTMPYGPTLSFLEPVVRGATVETSKQVIAEAIREMLYVWAIDTVSYSQMDDEAQLSVVRALMSEMSYQEPLASLQKPEILYLFTGDGMIVAVRSARRPKDLLVAASEFLRRSRTVYGFKIRMGINSGSGLVLRLSDSTYQAIGNVINDAVRIMSAAPENGLAISAAYFGDALQGGRVSLPGITFTPREASDKHGNLLRLYDVADS